MPKSYSNHTIPPAETRMPQATLRAQTMGVYPTLSSLQDAIDLAKSKLPITTENELMALIYTYHNSLLHQVECARKPLEKKKTD